MFVRAGPAGLLASHTLRSMWGAQCGGRGTARCTHCAGWRVGERRRGWRFVLYLKNNLFALPFLLSQTHLRELSFANAKPAPE